MKYYNDWSEFCLELLNIIDEILEKNKCLLYFFDYKKYLVVNEFDYDYNYDNYFNFMPRLHVIDNLKNVTYEYCGDLNKDDILKFIKDKIDIIKYNILITTKNRDCMQLFLALLIKTLIKGDNVICIYILIYN